MISGRSETPNSSGTTSPLRPPRPGDVIHYRYLWRHEAARKLEEGAKTRPCLVVATRQSERGLVVYTAPISSKNHDPTHSFLIPPKVQATLGLSAPSRIVWNDLNRFIWVGPDVELNREGRTYYGNIGRTLWEKVRTAILDAAIKPTNRTE